jgi:hypothetical protein
MAYIGREPQIGNFQICDAISTVNDQAAYTMQVSSVDVLPESANHMIVSLNGVIQKPNSSYTVSGATITFASNLVTGDVINFIQILGSVLDLGVPSDDTVSTAKIADDAVTTDKLANSINSAITANTAKVTNATHSGEVTGATALTIANNIVDEANLKVSNSPTNGYVLSAQSGNTGGLTWAEAGGGMHTLISTATISNAATAAITGMDSTYARYLITIDNLKCQTDGRSVYLSVIIGGSVQTGTNYPYGNTTRNSTDGVAGNESGDSTFWKISKSDIGNATGENYSGEITVYNPSETSQFKNMGWRSVYNITDGTVDSNIGGGMYNSGQAAITGVSIRMASGNIVSSVIKLYGIT